MTKTLTVAPHPAITVPHPPIMKEVHHHQCQILFVTCPVCNETREKPIWSWNQEIAANPAITGVCRRCKHTTPCPTHPAITIPEPPIYKRLYGRTSPIVFVTCPVCATVRELPMDVWRSRLKHNPDVTGICAPCNKRRQGGTARKPAPPPPEHPAISVPEPPIYKSIHSQNSMRIAIITCPTCGTKRETSYGAIRHWLKMVDSFTGICQSCRTKNSKRLAREKKAAERRARPLVTHRVLSNGYVVTLQAGIAEDDLPMYRAMMPPRGSWVFEHRWVIAKHLGRALFSYEWVDHMDGNKGNNDISNLRIYLKGKNQPGSGNGYGTYYHEWQMAEARIRYLEALVDRMNAYT